MLDKDGSLRHGYRLAKLLCTAIWNIHQIAIAHPEVFLTDSPGQGKDDFIYKDTPCNIFITSEEFKVSKSCSKKKWLNRL